MKKYILTIFVFILFFNVVLCQTTKQKIKIDRVLYINENGFLKITFNIVNLSKDTLFINYKMLNITAVKYQKIIKLDYPNVHEQPFIKPVFKNGEQLRTRTLDLNTEALNKEDPKEKSAYYFANKLFLKNLLINHKLLKYRDKIIQNIVDNCIVLLPSEIYEYETYLFSKKFNKTCKVSVKYSNSKRFTYFVDESGKKIDIYN